MKKRLLFAIFAFTVLISYTSFQMIRQSGNENPILRPPFCDAKSQWIDSAFKALTLEEKITQLFVYFADTDSMQLEMVKKYKLGSVFVGSKNGVEFKKRIELLRKATYFPLLLGLESNWGFDNFKDSTLFHANLQTIAALNDSKIMSEIGKANGKYITEANFDFNLTTFSESRQLINENRNLIFNISNWLIGFQSEHSAIGTFIPAKRVDDIQYRSLINSGISILAFQSDHLTNNVEQLNSLKNTYRMIVDTFGFKGITFAPRFFQHQFSDSINLKLLKIGFDFFPVKGNIDSLIFVVKTALSNGFLSKTWLDEKCKKVLQLKYWAVKQKSKEKSELPTDNEYLSQKIAEKSLTLLQNDQDFLPLKNLDTISVGILNYGTDEGNIFSRTANLFFQTKLFELNSSKTALSLPSTEVLNTCNVFIINIFYKIKYVEFLQKITSQLHQNQKAIVNFFFVPTSEISKIKGLNSLLINYENSKDTRNLSAQGIFGAFSINGKLPISISENWKTGFGLISESLHRLKYGTTTEVNIDARKLNRIDSIVKQAIMLKAFPGCQILAAKDGVVFFHKSFGHPTYESNEAVTNDQIYDLASITKIAATTIALMKLKDEKKFDEKLPISNYIPELLKTNKKDMLCSRILIHQAMLPKWTPFYTLAKGKNSKATNRSDLYNSTQTEKFQVQIADNIYVGKGLKDSMMQKVYNCKLTKKAKYEYTDLGFFLFMKVVENTTQKPLNQYVYENFYKPMGATTLGYKPMERFEKERVIPTEREHGFRDQLLQGYVHDYAAALLGGVSGHAGVFANSNDLAKLFQMLLQKGNYGGQQYISEKTIDLFTQRTEKFNQNRRGLGFDKPSDHGTPACKSASLASFGHTGFTGTIAWADPENGLVYIFLSNRVYPNSHNSKLIQMGIRSKLQQVLYDAMPQPSKTKKSAKDLANKL